MNGFVTVYGGDPPEAHSIPTRDLVDRAYFRSEMTGKCYFEFDKKSKQMRLTHPNLPELSSQHLGYVLEFLTQGTFTLLPPNEDNDPGTPFIQCGSAWEAAELLDMDDMIEHVADKLETEVKPWEMYDVLYFAGRLYDSDVTPYEATERLKAMLVKFIVDRYDEYQGSDELGNSFRNQLKSRRDLEEAIQAKRFGLVASQEASRDEDAER